ncbi:cytochrome P450 [Delitschia confertaspora ATCC 74209]|uniref:Cytochrome P450 n=1 Tax=Delitschia confertaspora ATCC 74209 TaxID=1513339 RepID=A0A9P4N1C2_9PLEO|nr:cytochrome P450 [Delitschia confertaspora ATCC 74209]
MKNRICAALSAVQTAVILRQSTLDAKGFLFVFFAFFLAQSSAVSIYNIFIYPFYRSPLRHLPGPKDNTPVLGQSLSLLLAPSPNALYLKWMQQFPDAPLIRYLHFKNSEWLLVNSLQVVKDMLQTCCYDLEKPEWFHKIVGEIAGVGLVNAEGELHRKGRKGLGGSFSVSNVKKIFPVINEKSQILSGIIDDAVQKNPDEPIEVSSLMNHNAIDVMGVAALGVELNSLATSGSTFTHIYETMFNQPPIGQAIFFLNMFIPIRRFLPWVKANTDYLHATTEVRRLLMQTIRERKAEVFGKGKGEKGEGARKEFTEEGSRDFLTFMLYEKTVEGWSDEEIHGHLMNFMSAGHETTAECISWGIQTLCLHPHIQDRLREEINRYIPHDGPPSYAELEKLKYMDNFLKEVLRCYSPSVLIPRSSSTPIRLPSAPHTLIPPGTTLYISPSVLHFNPTIWGPDAHVFNPDRHGPDHPSAKLYPSSRDPFANLAFSVGPRICIGKRFAALEIKSVLVTVLRAWEVRRGWDADGNKLQGGEEFVGHGNQREGARYEGPEGDLLAGIKVVNFLSLRPSKGIWVKFRKID